MREVVTCSIRIIRLGSVACLSSDVVVLNSIMSTSAVAGFTYSCIEHIHRHSSFLSLSCECTIHAHIRSARLAHDSLQTHLHPHTRILRFSHACTLSTNFILKVPHLLPTHTLSPFSLSISLPRAPSQYTSFFTRLSSAACSFFRFFSSNACVSACQRAWVCMRVSVRVNL